LGFLKSDPSSPTLPPQRIRSWNRCSADTIQWKQSTC